MSLLLNKTSTQPLVALVYLAFLVFPIYKASFMGNNYAPLSMFPLALLGSISLAWALLKSRLLIEELMTLTIVLYVGIVSLVYAVLANDMAGLLLNLPEFAPFVVGLLAVSGFKYSFQTIGIERSYRILYLSAKVVVAYGLLEVSCVYGPLPDEIRTIVAMATSGVVSGRVQLFTPEASWASIYLIFVMPVIFTIGSRFFKLASSLLFLAVFSAYGVATLIIGGALYLVVERKVSFGKLVRFMIVTGGAVLVLSSMFDTLVSFIFGAEVPYYISRISRIIELGFDDPEQLVLIDGSVFVRIMYPIYAALIFVDHPLGVGFYAYPAIFNSSIGDLPLANAALSNIEVSGDIQTLSADPRSLFTAILVSGGLVAGVLFAMVLLRTFRGLRRIESSSLRKVLGFQFCITLAACLQFGSFAFLPLWFCIAAIAVSIKNQNQQSANA